MLGEYNYVAILRQLLFSYFINALVFLIAPLSTFVLSRGMSIADFGVFSLLFIYWNLGLHGFAFGFNHFIQSYLPGRSKSEQEIVVGNSFGFVFWLSVVGGVLWFFFGRFFLSWLNVVVSFWVSLGLFLAIFVAALAVIPYAWLIAREEVGFSNVLYAINSSLWILLACVFFWFFHRIDVLLVVVFWIVGAGVQFFSSVVKLGWDAKVFVQGVFHCPIISRRQWWFSLPLIPLGLLQWLLTGVDRSFLSHFFGSEAVGLYALGYALVGLVVSFGNFVSLVFYPYIAKAWNRNDLVQFYRLVNAALKYNLMMVIPAVVGVFVLRDALVVLIGGGKFLVASSVVPFLFFFPVFACLLLVVQNVLLVQGRSGSVGLVYAVAVIVNFFLNRALIPVFGMKAAGVVTVVTYAFLFGSMFVRVRNGIVLNWKFLKIGRIFVAAGGMGFLLFFVHPETVVLKVLVVFLGCTAYVVLCCLLRVLGRDEWLVLSELVSQAVVKRFAGVQ